MPSPLVWREMFLILLSRDHAWVHTGRLDRCDRCGRKGAHPIYLGVPPDLLLMLCPQCELWVQEEMRQPDSGILGRTWHQVNGAYFFEPSPVKGPEGRA